MCILQVYSCIWLYLCGLVLCKSNSNLYVHTQHSNHISSNSPMDPNWLHMQCVPLVFLWCTLVVYVTLCRMRGGCKYRSVTCSCLARRLLKVTSTWLLYVSCSITLQLEVATIARLSNVVVMSMIALALWKLVLAVFAQFCSFKLWYSAAKNFLNCFRVLLLLGFLPQSLQALI